MSSADILAFPHSEPFPPAQVLDLAVSKDWFLRPATVGELAASIKRLLDRGSITRMSDGDFDFCLTPAGVEATTTLSGGMIRMIDRGRGYFKTAFLLQMLDLEKGKCP